MGRAEGESMTTTFTSADVGLHDVAADGETHADDCLFCAEFLEPILGACRDREAQRDDDRRLMDLERQSGCFDD